MRICLINLDRTPDRLAAFMAVNSHLGEVSRFAAVDGAALDISELIRNGTIRREILNRNETVPADIPAHYTAGAIGNALSHLALWQEAIESGHALTICEDDAIFHSRYVPTAESLLSALPADWDIILWGWNTNSPIVFEALPQFGWCLAYFSDANIADFSDANIAEGTPAYQRQPLTPMFYRLYEALGTVCYSVSPKGARAMREFCLPLRELPVRSIGLKGVVPNSALDIMLLALYRELKAFISFPPLVLTKNILAQSTVQARRQRPQGETSC
jgi:GR25 family glycosyltransferase involved in LPS biosynthesis